MVWFGERAVHEGICQIAGGQKSHGAKSGLGCVWGTRTMSKYGSARVKHHVETIDSPNHVELAPFGAIACLASRDTQLRQHVFVKTGPLVERRAKLR
jgi:hypothetical protein